jgi:valyl-tRNA synthetase
VEWLKQVVLGVRQIRGEMDISPARKLPLLMQHATARDTHYAQEHSALLRHLAGLEGIRILGPTEAAPPAASALVGDLTLLVPMAGLIDPAAEADRLGKRIKKSQAEIQKAQAKLGNANFVASAPPAVVTQERERLADFGRQLHGLERQLAQVAALRGNDAAGSAT